MRELVVAADDRTGALEVAGECAAGDGVPVLVVPFGVAVPAEASRVVVDLGSRHLPPDDAASRAGAVAALAARRHAHKIDSGLRGNWAAELAARVAVAEQPTVVVAALPAVGRACRAGVVGADVDGRFVPIHELLADDGRGAPRGSRPADHLREAGLAADGVTSAELPAWLGGARGDDIAVCDAASTADLVAIGAIVRSRRALVAGTAAAIAAWHGAPGAASGWSPAEVTSVLVVCGSLDGGARAQLDALVASDVPIIGVVTSPYELARPIPAGVAEAVAQRLADETAAMIRRHDPGVVVVLGGDTTAAVLGAAPMLVVGRVTAGAAVSRRADGTGPWFVTRSGSFGERGALCELVAGLVAGSTRPGPR